MVEMAGAEGAYDGRGVLGTQAPGQGGGERPLLLRGHDLRLRVAPSPG